MDEQVGRIDPEDMPGVELPPESAREFYPIDHERWQGIGAAKGYDQSYSRIKRVHFKHDALIDVMLAEPTITQGQLATQFKVTEAWLSRIIGSDAFQAALAKRRSDVIDPMLAASLEDKIKGLAHQSADIIADKLASTKSADLAIKTLGMMTNALGFGARDRGPASTTNNFVVQLPPKAQSSAAWADAHDPNVMKPVKPSTVDTSTFSTTITHDPTIQPSPMKLAKDEE